MYYKYARKRYYRSSGRYNRFRRVPYRRRRY